MVEGVVEAIRDLFPGAVVQHVAGDFYFMAREDQPMPFATLVTSDQHDAASDLGRAGIYRLNIGPRPETYRRSLGRCPRPARTGASSTPATITGSWTC